MQEFTKEHFEAGIILLINKPLDWTSFQAVKKIKFSIKKKFGIKTKVGHAGTLDPLADGLLMVCTGKKTKEIAHIQAQKKEYTGVFYLGATTPSYDLETEIDNTYSIDHLTEDKIREATQHFIGKIQQVPPIFSALKKEGKPLYKMAREGIKVDIPSREVEIEIFEIVKIALPKVYFRVVCSKGTYIRSLANDFGKTLQSGAYLAQLTRTKIGNYTLKDALEVDFLEK